MRLYLTAQQEQRAHRRSAEVINGNAHARVSGVLPQTVTSQLKFLVAKKVFTLETHRGDRSVKNAV